MTLNHKVLKKVNSPKRSPKLANSTLRRRTLLKRLSSGGDVQFGSSSKANLKVVVRVRPENQREIESNARSVVEIVDDHMMIFDPKPEENGFFFQGSKVKFRDLSKKQHKEQKFIFERVFNPLSTNQEVFETTTMGIIDTILNGYNCSVFAYGATGSGKTFTMIGTEDCPGITFMTVMELYKKIGELENKSCEVGVSYLEVYNETVRDLLVPGKLLNLHETNKNIQVTGLSLHKPQNAEELLKILAEGNKNRSQHPTDANSESSRSHAVFQVFVKQQSKSEGAISGVSIAKLSMIDLAGSERGSATGFKGKRFREGANINKSLLALGNCINALADGKTHIPYRDSKLTRLLKDSIGGNCRSVMIATITESSLSFEDTYNTLRYANRAKTIKTTLKKNIMNVDHHVAQYLKIMEDLKTEVANLKERLKEYEEKEEREEREVVMPASEETIQELKMQLEAKSKQEIEESEYEKELLSKLTSLNAEAKTIQREILYLETAERDFEYKIYSQKAHIVRMNVFVFASKKLEKGVSKSERLIQTFQKNFEHVKAQKQPLIEKLAKLKEQVVVLCENFKKKSPIQPENEEKNLPEPLYSKFKDMEMEQTVRNSMQIQEYLNSLVQNLIQKEATSEKLVSLLLATVKNLYLKLKMQKVCDEEADEFLEKIYAMLDCSRIEWADLKNTKDSFGEKIASDYVTLVPVVDEKKLTEFQIPNSIYFSPILSHGVSKIHKSNIIKPVLNLEQIPNDHPLGLNETLDAETPVPNMDNETMLNSLENGVSKFPDSTFSVIDSFGNGVSEFPDSTFSVIDSQSPLCSNTQDKSKQESPMGATACKNELKTFTDNPKIFITNDRETDEPAQSSDFLDIPSQSLVNSTFSINSPENITSTHSPKVATRCQKITGAPSPREKVTTLQPIPNNSFKKPLRMTSSKLSLSKNSFSGKSSTNLTLKRSTSSTSVFHSGAAGNSSVKSQIISSTGNKENVLKKSTSFIHKNLSNSASKNMDWKGGKTAFGSSYFNTPRPKLSTKRSLTYSHLPNPSEQLK